MPKPLPKMTSVEKLCEIAGEGIHAHKWYRDATAQINFVSDSMGWDRDRFAGVLATTSPRCSVLRNIRMSLHFMKYGDIRVVPMKGIRKSVTRFLSDGGITGPKTKAFYHNLSGNFGWVTLDVWMAYALGIDQTKFGGRRVREKAVDRVVSVACDLRIAPAEAQAAIWTGFRTRAGYNHSPFSVVGEYLKARDNNWEIEGCTIKEE